MYAGFLTSFTVQGIILMRQPRDCIEQIKTEYPYTMKEILETMKNVTIVDPMVTIKSAMKESDMPALEALADAIANA